MEPAATKPGRNEPCHCGSGKKYKQCCLASDEAAAREARAKAEAEAAAAAPAEDAPAEDEAQARDRHHHHPGRGRESRVGGANTRGFQKTSGAPRKVGGG